MFCFIFTIYSTKRYDIKWNPLYYVDVVLLPGGVRWLLCSMVCVACSMLAKEQGITAAAFCIVYDIVSSSKVRREKEKEGERGGEREREGERGREREREGERGREREREGERGREREREGERGREREREGERGREREREGERGREREREGERGREREREGERGREREREGERGRERERERERERVCVCVSVTKIVGILQERCCQFVLFVFTRAFQLHQLTMSRQHPS